VIRYVGSSTKTAKRNFPLSLKFLKKFFLEDGRVSDFRGGKKKGPYGTPRTTTEHF
jgi:hypothetical protein